MPNKDEARLQRGALSLHLCHGPVRVAARWSNTLKSRSAWTGRTSLYSLIVGHTFRLQAAVIALGLTLPFLAVIPLDLQAKLIDDAIPGGRVADIVSLAAMYGAVVAVTAAVKFLVTYIRGWIQEIVSRTLRVAIIEAQRHATAPNRPHAGWALSPLRSRARWKTWAVSRPRR